MAWSRKETSYYLRQCWWSSMTPHHIIRQQWVNWKLEHVLFYVSLMIYDPIPLLQTEEHNQIKKPMDPSDISQQFNPLMLKLAYSMRTWSIPLYWICNISECFSSTRKDCNCLAKISVKKCWKMQIHFVFSKINSPRQGLTHWPLEVLIKF